MLRGGLRQKFVTGRTEASKGVLYYLEIKVMVAHTVVFFTPYEFEIGQKIHIQGGPRGGDWEVIGVTSRKVKLRCPVTGKEVEWDRFCYFVEERPGVAWPGKD